MKEEETEEIGTLIRRLALQNAVQYHGKAQPGPIISRLIALRPGLRDAVKAILPTVREVVEEVNSLPPSEQRRIVEEFWPEMLVKERGKPEERGLPPLPNAESYPLIHLRFAPNPDGALHLGGARAAVLCDEYRKMYDGQFTLRFDDSDPRTKAPFLEAYDWIREDLSWLGVRWQREVYQSDRMEVYYHYAEALLRVGGAYVCTCRAEEFRRRLLAREACPCRGLPSEGHLERWGRMLDGTCGEGEAVVRIKTDLEHPNPAVRDWPALRIIDTTEHSHPRTGSRYRVWPLFAYCCGVDDHDLQISHILRGKEHLTNVVRQLYMYECLGWTYPDYIHYGRLRITGSVLSKSKIKAGVERGVYRGWDDPRLGTLMALRRRGYHPEAVRNLMIDFGPGPVDATVSWVNLDAYNRKVVDSVADRYFFVANPIRLSVEAVDGPYASTPPLHPDHPERGRRTIRIAPRKGRASILVSKEDLDILAPKRVVRLMGLFNMEVEEAGALRVVARLHSESYEEAKRLGAPLIHWLPEEGNLRARVVMPTNEDVSGFGEMGLGSREVGTVVQMERFGFGRIDAKTDDEIIIYYAHR